MRDYKYTSDFSRPRRRSKGSRHLLWIVLLLGAAGAGIWILAREGGWNLPLGADTTAAGTDVPSRRGTRQISIPLPVPPPDRTTPAPKQSAADLPPTVTKPGGSVLPTLENDSDAVRPKRNEVANRSAAHAIARKSPEAQGWRTHIIRAGETLSSIFSHLGFSARQLQQILSVGKETRQLALIKPGNPLRLRASAAGEIEELAYQIDEVQTLKVTRSEDGFACELMSRNVEPRVSHATGIVYRSLFEAAQRQGLSDGLILELAGIFRWDIDFALDLRSGDRFSVVYDAVYLGAKKVRDGRILAAEFTNRGNSHRAVRYTTPQGETDYYTPEGNRLRRAFLRTPVKFSRISSHFNLARRHPVLNRIRAHRGVDYAAPTGTPVHSTGDGRIVFKGTKEGYGKTVVIQHGRTYSTLYGHLSRYVPALRTGARVRQGQVIGYVGMTGLATGPHLHYEFRIHGRHRDPLRVKLPRSMPIDPEQKADFLARTQPLLAHLEQLRSERVAMNP
jgi:murein DD-endopeptidase MepM/ murein hydrolase activator NlpD